MRKVEQAALGTLVGCAGGPIRFLRGMGRHRTPLSTGGLRAVGLALLLSAGSLAVADPVLEGHEQCPVSTREQARSLGDTFFEQGAYQRAGVCYEAAGEYALANRAFVAAVGPQSAATRQRASAQGEQAKALLHKVRQAFGGER